MNKNVIDLSEVMERVQDDKELLVELFEIFREDFASKYPNLVAAVERGDFEQIKDLVHSIKGAAGNISAKDVHGSCVVMEQQALRHEIAGIKQSLIEINNHYKNLVVEMEHITKQFKG